VTDSEQLTKLLELLTFQMPLNGRPTASAQFVIDLDLSTRAVWKFSPAKSSSSKAGETWAKRGDC
jgi:hypothetical protein